jgi:OOP family OmpA-OmpF porin
MSLRNAVLRTVLALSVVSLAGFATSACKAKVELGPKPDPVPEPPPAPDPVPEPVPEPAPEPAKALDLPGPILFDVGTANLKSESDAPLNVVLEYLQGKPEVTKMRIEGHTDMDDTNLRNMELSKKRAMAAAKWLIAKGVDCNRLVVIGFGEERPVVTPEANADDKAKNRRVDFFPAERKGELIAGKPVEGEPGGQSAGDPCKK